ncbi:hypothetical protein HRbin36_01346 [bacterium HR36]|nr:hypothetical protein HRbin36_01346 [bacterium HR36]
MADPQLEHFIIPIPGLYEHTAYVRHCSRWFHQHQASFRGSAIEAAGLDVISQCQVVENRVVAPQGKFEAILAFRGTVAGTRIATEFAQDRHDILNETHAVLVAHPPHAKRNPQGLIPQLHQDFARSVANGLNLTQR